MPTPDEAIQIIRDRIKNRTKPTLVINQNMSALGFTRSISIALNEIGVFVATNHEATGTCCLWHAFMAAVHGNESLSAKINFLREFFDIEQR